MRLLHGDCVEVMAGMAEASVDAIVCDPPYGLEFMGKEWDRLWNRHENDETRSEGRTALKFQTPTPQYRAGIAAQEWHERWAREALRVLKPGGHALVMGGMRTHHRLICGLEDAGFEIRDGLLFLHGVGFPKSLNVSDAVRRTLPADTQCVCAPRSTRIARGSQSGYRSSDDSDGGRFPRESGGDLDAPPLQGDAHERNRSGPPSGGQVGALSNTSLDVTAVRPSMQDSVLQGEALGGSRSDGNESSGTPSSTLSAPSKVAHRTAPSISDTPHSDDDSASSSFDHLSGRNAYISHCTTCGGVVVQDGIGTALKPAAEYIVLARKPLVGTVAANVLRYGTGGLNIDGCRIEGGSRPWREPIESAHRDRQTLQTKSASTAPDTERGRWPANVVLGCACDEGPHDRDCAVALLDAQSGGQAGAHGGGQRTDGGRMLAFGMGAQDVEPGTRSMEGGASRFFYTAKSSRAEREFGLENLQPHTPGELTDRKDGAAGTAHPRAGAGRAQTADYGDASFRDGPGSPDRGTREDYVYRSKPRRNDHPTVKPVDLMRWLCRLVTPPGGVVLDPFCGSGSTGMAALDEGFEFIGIDQDEHYLAIARKRIEARHLLETAARPPSETRVQGVLL